MKILVQKLIKFCFHVFKVCILNYATNIQPRFDIALQHQFQQLHVQLVPIALPRTGISGLYIFSYYKTPDEKV